MTTNKKHELCRIIDKTNLANTIEGCDYTGEDYNVAETFTAIRATDITSSEGWGFGESFINNKRYNKLHDTEEFNFIGNLEGGLCDMSKYEKINEKKDISEASADIIFRNGKIQRSLNEVAESIVAQVKIQRIENGLYYFAGNIWKPLNSSQSLRLATLKVLDCHNSLKENNWRELMRILQSWFERFDVLKVDDEQFYYYICFKNGVYDVMNDELLAHSERFPFVSYIDFEYWPQEKGTSVVFEQYLNIATMYNENIKKRLLQWISYSISNLPNLKKIALVMGTQNSGKSTCGNIIKTIVGDENVGSFNFATINRFSNHALFGKFVALSTDVGKSRISDFACEWLKKQTGGDEVYSDVKGKDGYTYVSKCKFMLASNYRPRFNDYALDDRMLVIPMPYSLRTQDINTNLLNEIELDIQLVLSQLMECLREFINDGMIFQDIGEWESYEPESFNMDIRNVNDFFKKRCYYDKQILISRDELYAKFIHFCEENDIQIQKRNVFLSNFKSIAKKYGIKDDTNNGRRYKGLAVADVDLVFECNWKTLFDI